MHTVLYFYGEMVNLGWANLGERRLPECGQRCDNISHPQVTPLTSTRLKLGIVTSLSLLRFIGVLSRIPLCLYSAFMLS
jgi:hypothetical protein